VDKETQVEDVRELFSFDTEVAPLLDVIVAKTIEQATFELQAEEELATLDREVEWYDGEREKELIWRATQGRIASAEAQAKNEIVAEAQTRFATEMELRTRIGGICLVSQLVPRIFEEVAESLFASGEWKHTERVTAEENAPSIMAEAVRRAEVYYASAEVLDELLVAAQERYTEAPELPPLGQRSQQKLTLKFKVDKERVGGEEDIDMSVEIAGKETCVDVENKVRRDLLSREPPVNVTLDLRAFVSSAIGRPIARDAPILNFAMPESIDIAI
jgi:hypothetical protein